MSKKANNTTALVLSGGGSKGAFQVGVLQVLKEKGYTFDVISGVSVGSLNGAMLSTGQLAELIHVWETLDTKDVLKKHSLVQIASAYLMYKAGLGKPPLSRFNNEPLHRLMLDKLLGKSISIPFHFGYVNIRSGVFINAVVRGGDHHIDKADISRLLASTAIPVAFKPVIKEDTMYVDGGLRNISPIKEVLPYNPDRVIIIPTQPLKDRQEHVEPKDIIEIAFRAINIMLDEIFNNDIDRFLTTNKLVQQAGKENAVLRKSNGQPYKYIEPLIIAPEKSLGSSLDFENKNLRRLLELGRRRAEQLLKQGLI